MAVAEVFAALGDETRLVLVNRLAEHGPQRTGDLVAGLSISRQAASKHLEVLENAGVVRSEKRGREVLRSLETERVGEAVSWLEGRARLWEDRLGALKRFVEEG